MLQVRPGQIAATHAVAIRPACVLPMKLECVSSGIRWATAGKTPGTSPRRRVMRLLSATVGLRSTVPQTGSVGSLQSFESLEAEATPTPPTGPGSESPERNAAAMPKRRQVPEASLPPPVPRCKPDVEVPEALRLPGLGPGRPALRELRQLGEPGLEIRESLALPGWRSMPIG